MNAPARKFSLQRVLAPAPAAQPAAAPAPAPLEILPSVPPAGVGKELPEEAAPAVAAPATSARPAPKSAPDPKDRAPKKKRSYSVDLRICEDLELIAWAQRRSSSSIVEDLMRRYVASHKEDLERARAAREQLGG